jgi:hypothetical protein
MKNKVINVFVLITALFGMSSCLSSKSTIISSGINLSDYKYIVFAKEDNGDAELADILMMVQNELSGKLEVLSPLKAQQLLEEGKKILSPRISVKSEKWDGGHTYISISFYDYDTNQSVAVVKSSGIGFSISQDQRLAFSAIKKELNKVFMYK